jgi:hypothetical protein
VPDGCRRINGDVAVSCLSAITKVYGMAIMTSGRRDTSRGRMPGLDPSCQAAALQRAAAWSAELATKCITWRSPPQKLGQLFEVYVAARSGAGLAPSVGCIQL